MPSPKGKLITPVAFDANDFPRSLKVDADDHLKIDLAAQEADVDVNIAAQDANVDVNIAAQAADVDVNIAAQDADVEVKQQNPADLRVGLEGWIGAAWKKNPLLMGYSGDVTGQQGTANAAAGANVITGTSVPAGELWRLQAVNAINFNKDMLDTDLSVDLNGLSIYLISDGEHIANRWLCWAGEIIMSQGDAVSATLRGCDLNNDIYLRFHAIRVDIDQ